MWACVSEDTVTWHFLCAPLRLATFKNRHSFDNDGDGDEDEDGDDDEFDDGNNVCLCFFPQGFGDFALRLSARAQSATLDSNVLAHLIFGQFSKN